MKIAIRELLTLSFVIVILGAVYVQGLEAEVSNSHKKNKQYDTPHISKYIILNYLHLK